ncbi:MAG: Hsp20 family protein [Alphaproteobacteria bacterium]|nr:Hsp20 family protein [Alphaproteobacteria bacterium]
MRTYDLSPLFRSTVGFDRLSTLMDAAFGAEEAGNGYPPYNIEKLDEDAYRITMAMAGFAEKDISLTAQDNLLVIAGRIQGDGEGERKFLYRGIATRAFERKFSLADHIKVTGASLVNGLLHVELAREVPEAMKPRQIKIATKTAKESTVIEGSRSAA